MIGLGATPFIAQWVHSFLQSGPVAVWLQGVLGGSALGMQLLSLLGNEMMVSVLCFGIFWTAFEVASIAGKPIFDGLINDVVPQPLLGRFYGLFRAVSLIDGMIFNYWIMGYVPTHFTVIMVSVGLFYGAAFTWVCFRVKEGGYPPPSAPLPSVNRIDGFIQGVRCYGRECFSHSYYLWVFILIMMAGISFGPINVFTIPFARSVGVSMDIYGKAVALTFLISLVLAYPLGWLADRFHPLRMAIAVLGCYALAMVWGSIFARDAESFLFSWILHGVLSGAYVTSAASLAQRLFPHEKFAQFVSAAAILMSCANIVMAPLVGLVIDRSGGVYRYAFSAALVLTLTALVSGLVVYARFKKLGGPRHYKAPDYAAGKVRGCSP